MRNGNPGARVVCALILVSSALLAADPQRTQGAPRSFETSKQEGMPAGAGSVIQVDHSYGYLTVEGWDEPEVEITVTKSTDKFFKPSQEPRATQRFDDIRIGAEHPGGGPFTITTTLPVR